MKSRAQARFQQVVCGCPSEFENSQEHQERSSSRKEGTRRLPVTLRDEYGCKYEEEKQDALVLGPRAHRGEGTGGSESAVVTRLCCENHGDGRDEKSCNAIFQ